MVVSRRTADDGWPCTIRCLRQSIHISFTPLLTQHLFLRERSRARVGARADFDRARHPSAMRRFAAEEVAWKKTSERVHFPFGAVVLVP